MTPLHPALVRFRGEAEADHAYPDLHQHIEELARRGLLVVVDEPINKDTEMHPLVRWQFRCGIGERGTGAPSWASISRPACGLHSSAVAMSA